MSPHDLRSSFAKRRRGITATAVWEVTDSDPYELDTFQFGLMIAYHADPENSLPSAGVATASLNYAPLTSGNSTAGSSAAPRFADYSTLMKLFEINSPRP